VGKKGIGLDHSAGIRELDVGLAISRIGKFTFMNPANSDAFGPQGRGRDGPKDLP
jgi:hypothetical protein